MADFIAPQRQERTVRLLAGILIILLAWRRPGRRCAIGWVPERTIRR